jgi:DNA-binding transcriptional LysR family regulator
VEFTPLVDLPVHAVVGESHPLALHSAVTLEELAPLPLILLDLPLSAEYFLAIFMKEGLQPNIAFRISHPDVIRTMVANGYGYTLANVTPRSDMALDGRKVVRVRLSGEHRPMTIGLATLRQMKKSRLLTAFASHARSFISDAYIPGMVPPAMGQKKR